MANVVLSGVTKTYPAAGNRPAFTAVRGIDLEVRDGEFMVLVGPSGCGKSTTLRMIAGLDEASGGTITIGGRVVNDLRPNERDIAMVFQSYALYPHMSVYDNMAFGLTLQKLPRTEIDQRVKEAANLLGLAEVLDRKPKTLSGGQRQRVAVGRAIVRQPKVFLFDEPLSNLDAKMRVSMRAELSRLHDRLGATMIYVTHDQVEAMTLGDRICIMNEGAIVQTDTPLNLYQRPAALFAAGFIGSPAMNFFSGRIDGPASAPVFVEDNDDAGAVRLALPPRLASAASARAGRPVILGVRPEDVGPERAATPGCEARARLEVAELMGAETFLHLSTGKTTFVARAPNRAYAPGDLIPVTFDLERAHLFDPTTTASLV